MNTLAGSNGMVRSAVARHVMVRKLLLVCGIVAPVLYVVTIVIADLM